MIGGSTEPAGVLPGQRLPASVRPCHCVGEPQSCVDAVRSCDISLRALIGDPCEKADIVEGMDGRRERKYITAASAAYLNHALEPTAYSLRYSDLGCRTNALHLTAVRLRLGMNVNGHGGAAAGDHRVFGSQKTDHVGGYELV